MLSIVVMRLFSTEIVRKVVIVLVMVIVAVIVVEDSDVEDFYGYRNAQGKKMYVPPNLSERFLFQRTPFRRLDGFKSVWHNSNC